jgi:type IV pilus assembly protein PilV
MKLKMNRTKGFTLIEVLVALVVVAMGLIGMAGIQGAAVKYTKSAEGRNHAVQLAYDIQDRIRTSRATLVNGGFASASSMQGVTCDRNFATTAVVQAEADVDMWRNQIACLLPGGQGSIQIGAVDATSGLFPVTVSVQWSEGRVESGSNTHTYVARAQI